MKINLPDSNGSISRMGTVGIRYSGRILVLDVNESATIFDICLNISKELNFDSSNIVLIHKGTKYISSSRVSVNSLLSSKKHADFVLQLNSSHWMNADLLNWIGKEVQTVVGYIEEIPKRKKQLKLDYSINSIRLHEINSDIERINSHLSGLEFSSDADRLKILISQATALLL